MKDNPKNNANPSDSFQPDSLLSRRSVLRNAGILAAASAIPLLSNPVTAQALEADAQEQTENTASPETATPESADQTDAVLRFREDGTFRVLILADIHIHGKGNLLPSSVVENINTLVDREEPDLVIFAGDTLDHILQKQEDFKTSLAQMVEHIEELGTPWSFTFGNHDCDYSGFPKDAMFEIYQSFEHCIIEAGPDDVYGMGNCVLPILCHAGERVGYNVWLIDSGDWSPSGFRNEFMPVYSSYEGWSFSRYASIDPSIVNWYYNTSRSIEKQANGLVPGIMVCHIPIQEYYSAWKNRTHLSYTGIVSENTDGRTEGVSSGEMNTGMFGALWKRGDIKLMAFGHDHRNDFATRYGGIWLCGVSTPSPLGYWTEEMAGGRVVTLHEDGSLSTRMSYLFKEGWSLAGVDAPETASVGQSVSFAPLVEGSNDGLLFNYVWQFGSTWDLWSSTVKETGEMTSDTQGSFTPPRIGTYHLWVDAKDSKGKTQTSKEKIIEVENLSWKVTGVNAPVAAEIGQEIDFSAIIEGDSSGLRYNYVWRFGTGWDLWSSTVKETGSKTAERTSSFIPTKAGLWQVWIDVEDEFGNAVQTQEYAVTVDSVWKLKGVEVAEKGEVGKALGFSAIIEGDSSGLRYNYVWRFGTGWDLWSSTVKETGSKTAERTSSFIPTKAGLWQVWIDVEDEFGNTLTSNNYDIAITVS